MVHASPSCVLVHGSHTAGVSVIKVKIVCFCMT